VSDDKTTIIKSDTDIFQKMVASASSIEVFFKGTEYRFSRDELPVSAGRDSAACKLVCSSNMASRVHFTIDIKDNQIGVCDTSTNGTYIKMGRSDAILIKDSFYPLSSQGHISCGEAIDLNSPEIIHFRICAESK